MTPRRAVQVKCREIAAFMDLASRDCCHSQSMDFPVFFCYLTPQTNAHSLHTLQASFTARCPR